MEKSILLPCGELQIPCRLSRSDYGQVRRIVMGVHGFGGSADDSIQASIAEEMEMFYGAAIRFDFPAHGLSPHGSEYLTVKNCMDSVITVAEFARKEFPEVEDLCIFATGFGAYITLLCLQDLVEMPGRIKLVVQTPAVLMHETMLAMKKINRETLWAMDRVTINAPRPFDVTYALYEELRANIALTTQPIPMLILQGEEDEYVRTADIQQFHRINERSKLVIIPGARHRFQEEGAWDMVLDLTRDWFEYEQVLLSDWT